MGVERNPGTAELRYCVVPMRSLVVCSVVALFLGAGCTHSIRRAALVPHQQPVAHSARPVQTKEFSIGSPNALRTAKPRLSANQNAGIAIPRWQGQGALRMPWGPDTSVGLHFDYGLDEGSVAVSDDQPDPEGDVFGAAVSMLYSAKFSPEFSLGLAGQVWLYSIPYVEYDTCVDCPFGPWTEVEHDRDAIPVFSFALLPTFELSPAVSVFGGLTLRNHPTIQKSDIDIGPDDDFDEEVETGPLNSIGSIGAEVALAERIKLTGYLHRPIAADPVIYGVAAGLMLTFVAEPEPAGR